VQKATRRGAAQFSNGVEERLKEAENA